MRNALRVLTVEVLVRGRSIVKVLWPGPLRHDGQTLVSWNDISVWTIQYIDVRGTHRATLPRATVST
jgi:hypothetical protein